MYTQTELQLAVDNSFSYQDVLRNLNRKTSGSLFKCIKNNIAKYKIDISHFKSISQIGQKRPIFIFGITKNRVSRPTLLKALLKAGIDYKCSKCSIDKWNNESIVLEIHHIDSNCYNNHLNNLVLLCPNCHSQIEHKKAKKVHKNLCACGHTKAKTSDMCRKCYYDKYPPEYKISWPSDEDLIKMYYIKPMSQISKDLGVALTTIRKKIYSLNVEPLGKGYWQKKLQSKN